MVRSCASVVGLVLVLSLAARSETAVAQGVHFAAGPVHIDIGRPHVARYPYPYPGYANYGPTSRGYGVHRAYRYGGWGAGRAWHDTTHLDYHPGGFVRHYNHYHYIPAHYDVHHSGHWHGRR